MLKIYSFLEVQPLIEQVDGGLGDKHDRIDRLHRVIEQLHIVREHLTSARIIEVDKHVLHQVEVLVIPSPQRQVVSVPVLDVGGTEG